MGIIANYKAVLANIRRSAEAVGRDPEEVTLMVVSKTWSAEDVKPLADHGHCVFGENRIQEAAEKIPCLPDGLKWHLIGHLQKNKVRKALPHFDVIESVDSLDLALQISRISGELGGPPQQILLQVKVAEEAQKHGFSTRALSEQLGDILALPHLVISGLMAMPPWTPDPEAARPHFMALRLFRDALTQRHGVPLGHLSMGMTNDYPVAIAEGATIVRVGSAIFGTRG